MPSSNSPAASFLQGFLSVHNDQESILSAPWEMDCYGESDYLHPDLTYHDNGRRWAEICQSSYPYAPSSSDIDAWDDAHKEEAEMEAWLC